MIGWIKGLSSLKMMLLVSAGTAAIVGSTAFIVGVRWEKADRYEEALVTIQKIEEQATTSLNTLNTRWNAAAEDARIAVQDWNLQNTVDQDLFDRLLAGQLEIKDKFDEIQNDIFITTDFGVCQLSDDAVRLLRESAATANSGLSRP